MRDVCFQYVFKIKQNYFQLRTSSMIPIHNLPGSTLHPLICPDYVPILGKALGKSCSFHIAVVISSRICQENHRLAIVECSVCCFMSDTQIRPKIENANSVSQTPLKASTKELTTPSYHPSGRCLISSRSSLIRRISSSAPGWSPNLSQSRALRMF
jgi:hypothetical protein